MNRVAKMFRGWHLTSAFAYDSATGWTNTTVLVCVCGTRTPYIPMLGADSVPELIDRAMTHAFECVGARIGEVQ